MTSLETARQALEDIDFLELAGSIAFREKGRCNERRKILWDHRVVKCTAHMKENARRALKILADDNKQLEKEAAYLIADGDRQLWLNFYESLRGIQSAPADAGAALVEARDANYFVMELMTDVQNLAAVFDDAEVRGRVIGLEPMYEEFINWKSYKNYRAREHEKATMARIIKLRFEREKKKRQAAAKQDPSAPAPSELKMEDIHINTEDSEIKRRLQFCEIDYVKYIRTVLSNFKLPPRHCKYRDPDYKRYLTRLSDYLRDFYRKTRPLGAWAEFTRQHEKRFDHEWSNKDTLIPHWAPFTHQLENLYAPATDRLFGSEAACAGHIKGKKYSRQQQKLSKERMAEMIKESEAHDKQLAHLEFWCSVFLEELVAYVEATVQHVRKKQSRSLDELIIERGKALSEDEEGDAEFIENNTRPKTAGAAKSDDSDSDDEGLASRKIRNPLNLPLGWDGKPIPYWLYKLHGLSQEFTCEICGNQKYWGRQVFERHFQEWRHAFGMRCLKIPNTVHFKDITKIDDALQLYEKVKFEAAQKAFLADQEVEVEDAHGNVMTPKTYEDLRRQGLL